jgi:hypothetical protein
VAVDVSLDIERDVITLYGVNYSLQLFHSLAFLPIGTVVEIVARKDGTLTLKEPPAPSHVSQKEE